MGCGVVVVAAGQGKRLGQSLHKALVPLVERPLFFFCVESFSASPAVDEVVVVVHADDLDTFSMGEIGHKLAEMGVTKVVEGGARRQDSVLKGLEALDASLTNVLVHDAARPFVKEATIVALVAALEHYPGAVPVVSVTSTVKQVDGDNVVRSTVPRANLRLAQTPQAARKDLLIASLKKAADRGVEVTDDVQAMELSGHSVLAVEDSRWNFKVTTPDDLRLATLVVRNGLHQED